MTATVASFTDVRTPPPVPSLAHPARRIASDAEAIAVARGIAADIAAGAPERDRERRLPYAELDRLSEAGLFAITVPRAYGGPEVSPGTLAEVIATLAAETGRLEFYNQQGTLLRAVQMQEIPPLPRVLTDVA